MLQRGVEIFRPVGARLRTEKAHPDEVGQPLFERLAVLFVKAEQEKGKREGNHDERRPFISNRAPREKIRRDAQRRAAAKADQLARGQV